MKLKKSLLVTMIVSGLVAGDMPIFKTGETTSSIVGDDGYYQKGVAKAFVRDDTKEIVEDKVLKLMWQDDSEAKSITKSWSDAQIYCEDLSLGGYTDYRLPTRVELESLIDFSKYNPAIDNAFKNISSSYYWSSTTGVYNSANAWYVNFSNGRTNYYNKSNSRYVRCVRGGQ